MDSRSPGDPLLITKYPAIDIRRGEEKKVHLISKEKYENSMLLREEFGTKLALV
jgi:hypothetical protein